eukprot:jgi/Chrzof1/9619/Cz04g09270.t1
MGYGNFYSNACMLLGSLKRGMIAKTPCVTFPMSKFGLEICKTFRNLGIIDSFEAIQKHNRVGKTKYKVWLPGKEPETSAEMQGYPAMFLKINLKYDKHKPIFTLPGGLGPLVTPISFKDPTPESVKVISKPTLQRFMNKHQLVSARNHMPPGIFLVSTSRGVLTDIEAELLQEGGIVLGHIGLPLGQVVQLRSVIREKLTTEQAAASSSSQVQHAPLHQFDVRKHLHDKVKPRFLDAAASEAAGREAFSLLDDMEAVAEQRQQELRKALRQVGEMQLEEAAWKQRHKLGDQLARHRPDHHSSDGHRSGGHGTPGDRWQSSKSYARRQGPRQH